MWNFILLAGLFCHKACDAFQQSYKLNGRNVVTDLTKNQFSCLLKSPTNIGPSFDRTLIHLSGTSNAEEPYTIQILMSDTGGGHRASANALRDAFDELYPGKILCDIVDVYTDYAPWPMNTAVPAYKIMAEYSFLWDWFYHLGATPFGLWINEIFLEATCFDDFKRCLSRPSGTTSTRADMVVSVHPLTQFLPLKVLADLDSNGQTRDPARGRTKTPFVTVVTDLGGAHPTWFDPNVDRCYVPSDALYKCARDRGIKPEQIIQFGLPIRRGFWGSNDGIKKDNQKAKEELRQKLGIDPNAPAVLVVGGGDGMGGIVATASSLGDKLAADAQVLGQKFQMVVVCGNNKNAKETLSSRKWNEGVHVAVNGFVNNMDEWMRASDAIVTKAGPGTIAEASICGLPCLLSSYLPGQEAGNIPFVEQNGFGTYKGEPTEIANTVSEWLESPEKLEKMQNAALKAARPSATLDIAKSIAEILFQKVQKT